MLSHQILHTQEAERKRISHNLHDEIAQTLVAINLHLAQLAQGAATSPANLAKKIAATQKLVESSVESVHRFAMDLRPTQIDDLGLLSALRSYIREFSHRNQIPVELTGLKQLKSMDDRPAVVLFRVAQAALTNIAQHAKAKQIKIEIRQNQRSLRMVISDDGASFDGEKTLGSTKKKRLGIVGMRERVEMVGGKFSIVSSPGRGTTVSVSLPMSKTASGTLPSTKGKP